MNSFFPQLNIEFPLFAFSHCRDVVVEVSKAGGIGILGAVGLTPEQLEIELAWIDEHIDNKPYGVDIIVPTSIANPPVTKNNTFNIPDEYKQFVRAILAEHEINTADLSDASFDMPTTFNVNTRKEGAMNLLDVAFSHPIKLIANALGVPPTYMLERGKKAGVTVAALVGSKRHALLQAEAGVDIIIASGSEAGGHCGEISTMVLIPEVIAAISDFSIPVLAAGGIVTGRQMAACMAMGAAGAWTGSVWLTTVESETSPVIKEKLLTATSSNTIRSKSRTGKYSRQLRSAWTDAWETENAPQPLPMPLQSSVTERALAKVNKLADANHSGAIKLATYWVGQGVGLMNSRTSSKAVVYEFMQDFLAASERLQKITNI